MTDPSHLVALASAGTLAVAMACGAALKGWRGWLELRRLEGGGRSAASGRPRAEIAELRARVRRLEAIANGAES